ncbi:helix-turn-helix domain-containing protein [Allomuricauda sp. SCSIO 65647]|uniref:helix-turn-helix domain-containing protein n=1 Tax=Allomuricauda sp. SCSIO 65647 TaxID=2908843 RepID=UPI001F1DE02B|nr:AraC family transcriptional regulator [Muricauda sp. SCSIO 65647]UJH66523.1 AraC family transcriptional regulator [Muricauda sp. SCSIO 65647]
MDFEIKADLIPLFRGLVTGLVPYAQAQDVELRFQPKVDTLYASYNPQKVLSEITVLLSRVITFTPQSYQIKVSIGSGDAGNDKCMLVIENTGVNLSKLGEIIASVSSGLSIEELPKGTRFVVEIPIAEEKMGIYLNGKDNLLPKQYPQYFSTIHKRLTNYFDNTAKIQEAAEAKGSEYGVFMKKVNAVINANIDNCDFSVDGLADAMALSRAQLFRKVKQLTQMSPSAYIKFTRLEEAKHLLQSKKVDFNVTEVSYAVGFSNVSHFTRSFKKQFGMNPSSLVA